MSWARVVFWGFGIDFMLKDEVYTGDIARRPNVVVLLAQTRATLVIMIQ